MRFFASGYTESADEPGVLLFDVDEETGEIELVAQAAGVSSPSFCALAGGRLYAASETPDRGGLAAYALDAFGAPKVASQVSFEGAAGTCFALRHPQGRCLYGADYNSGSVCWALLDADDNVGEPVTIIQHEGHGAPRTADDPNRDRQLSPHVHTLSFIPETTLLAAVDLGLDAIVVYATDGVGRLVDAKEPTVLSPWAADGSRTNEVELPLKPAAIIEAPLMSGPRIVAYHPSLPFAALICELGCKLIVFRMSEGGLRWVPAFEVDLLEGVSAETLARETPLAAHVAFSADGRFLYASTRGPDIVSTFSFASDGTLHDRTDIPSGGRTPRHFALSPSGRTLAVANQNGGGVQLFKRDGATGKLEPWASAGFPHPSCIAWVRSD